MSQSFDLRATFELSCPVCGQADHLHILITTLARLTSEGSDPEGDHEWDDSSYCRCPECAHDGIVADFRHSVSDAPKASLANSNSKVQS
jgi:hypothetical protein